MHVLICATPCCSLQARDLHGIYVTLRASGLGSLQRHRAEQHGTATVICRTGGSTAGMLFLLLRIAASKTCCVSQRSKMLSLIRVACLGLIAYVGVHVEPK